MRYYFINLFTIDSNLADQQKNGLLISEFIFKIVEYMTIIGALKFLSIKSSGFYLENIVYIAMVGLQLYVVNTLITFRINLLQLKDRFLLNRYFNNTISIAFIGIVGGLLLYVSLQIINALAAAQAM
jgi:hypothetical protein